MEKIEFEVITRPTRKYTLDDLKTKLASGESVERQAFVWVPPKLRKGKWGRRRKEDVKEKKKKNAKGPDSTRSEGVSDISDGDDSWDKSSKTRRHKKQFVI